MILNLGLSCILTFLLTIDYFDKTGLSPMACHVTVWPAVVFSVPKTAKTDRSVCRVWSSLVDNEYFALSPVSTFLLQIRRKKHLTTMCHRIKTFGTFYPFLFSCPRPRKCVFSVLLAVAAHSFSFMMLTLCERSS